MGNESNGAVLIAQIKKFNYNIITKLKIVRFGYFQAIFSEAFVNLIFGCRVLYG